MAKKNIVTIFLGMFILCAMLTLLPYCGNNTVKRSSGASFDFAPYKAMSDRYHDLTQTVISKLPEALYKGQPNYLLAFERGYDAALPMECIEFISASDKEITGCNLSEYLAKSGFRFNKSKGDWFSEDETKLATFYQSDKGKNLWRLEIVLLDKRYNQPFDSK